MLDSILTDDAAVARYRTIALGLVAALATWAENRFGFGVVGELSDIVGLAESTVTMALAWVIGGALYLAAQRWPAVDRVIHLGARAEPTYIDVESREL